jgi:hypothetical protein
VAFLSPGVDQLDQVAANVGDLAGVSNNLNIYLMEIDTPAPGKQASMFGIVKAIGAEPL